jgi:hypothetical protein
MAGMADGADSFTSHIHVRRDPSNAVSEEKRGNPIIKLLGFRDRSAVNGFSDSDVSQIFEAALNRVGPARDMSAMLRPLRSAGGSTSSIQCIVFQRLALFTKGFL